MLAPQRHDEILRLLDEKGTLRTVDLAEIFEVTDETIRRDLQVLAETGRLARIHGGASSLSGRPRLRSFSERSALNIEKKKAIARAAVQLIQPGRCYAFDSSTTAIALVSILPDLPYRVVSNAFAVFEYLISMESVELVSTGGRFQPATRTFVSPGGVASLRSYHIDTAFVSSIGFDLHSGASEGFEEQATYKETLVEHADQVVLLLDSTKFGQHSEYYFAAPGQIDHIVTDSGVEPAIAQSLRDRGIELTIAE